VSDRRAWLDDRCPECRTAPGARCGRAPWTRSGGRVIPAALHVARGWCRRRCPTCKALPGERCRTPTGRHAAQTHAARLYPERGELFGAGVWEELERRGATIAQVPFSGRAGLGGQTEVIRLSRCEGDQLVDVERWPFRDELAYALEAPVWDRYGTFAGHRVIRGVVPWTTEDRLVVIGGERGGVRFEAIVS
jgi:hypothetical protein